MAVVGDIGIRSKLDYTAHGDSINSAARLEALNKVFGSTICVGPVAASQCDAAQFRPLGVASLRGLETSCRGVRALAAGQRPPPGASVISPPFGLKDRDRERAAAMFEDLVRECPDDAVPCVLLSGLREGTAGEGVHS